MPRPPRLPRPTPLLLALALVACQGGSEPMALQSADGVEQAAVAAGADARRSIAFGGIEEARDAAAPGGAVAEGDLVIAPAAPPPPPPSAAAPRQDATARRGAAAAEVGAMLIRSGSATVEVEDLDAALRDLSALAVRLGGTVAGTTVLSGRARVPSATVELRLPPARYDDALGGLSPIGAVQSVQVAAEDVGEEYTDLAARAANARRLEERLLQLLATRTGRLEDVLQVERELARVREEVERIEGRLRWLRARTATSTLAVTVHEPVPLAGAGPGRHPIADAFRQAWANLVGAVAFGIAASGIVLPVALLGLVLWLGVRRLLPRPAPARGGAADGGATG